MTTKRPHERRTLGRGGMAVSALGFGPLTPEQVSEIHTLLERSVLERSA